MTAPIEGSVYRTKKLGGMTERDARKMAVQYPRQTTTGWLLACSSPSNICKGQGQYDEMSEWDRSIVQEYRDHCIAVYARETPDHG